MTFSVSWILTEHSEIFLTETVVIVMRIALLSMKKKLTV